MIDLALATSEPELSLLDAGFAGLVRRLAAREHAEIAGVTAALVSRERRAGHPCIDLARWAGRAFTKGGSQLPDLATWAAALRASGVAGSGTPATPLVLDESERCYLHRYWSAERRVAQRILKLAAVTEAPDTASAASLFRELFPPPAPGDEDADRQAWIAAAALRNRLTVVSGGPGTGKTTTVARVLAMLLSGDERLTVALAAPTGKAAARLTESIRSQAAALPVSASVHDRIARVEAQTLHRLLRYVPRSGEFRHDAERPLTCDVLVIDEASMVDLLLMDAVLAAVPPHGRVVLMGDKDQLASIEAGFVFGDCCEAAARGGLSSAFAEHFARLSGRTLTSDRREASGGPLADCGLELRLAWRFRDRLGIGQVADAVRRSAVDDALAAFADPELTDTARFDLPNEAEDVARANAGAFQSVVESASPAQALAQLNQARILCATRLGPWGVERLNDAVERVLGVPAAGEWYRGRPLLVTANDYTVGLFNGDVGICFPDEEGRMRVWFNAGAGARSVPAAKLPRHETAWAMTVHKSQGSEFERVTCVVPDGDSALLNRELIYTAVTRAKEHVTVFANVAALRLAIERKAERVSGLGDLLVSGHP